MNSNRHPQWVNVSKLTRVQRRALVQKHADARKRKLGAKS